MRTLSKDGHNPTDKNHLLIQQVTQHQNGAGKRACIEVQRCEYHLARVNDALRKWWPANQKAGYYERSRKRNRLERNLKKAAKKLALQWRKMRKQIRTGSV